ncbi:MAG: hypothetical protein ACK4HE_11620 [Chitinophagaceae bacterium]
MQLKYILILAILCTCCYSTRAQNEFDGIMMSKQQFCTGFMYGNSSWTNYWEGTLERNNLNLGRVRTQSIMYGANYGITDRLNVLVGLPYVITKASAGQLAGMQGIQDGSLTVKYMPLEITKGKSTYAIYAVGTASTPLSNYVKDYLPLSIGLGSTNLSIRAMFDYQYKRWFATLSSSYIRRSNITLDRNAYFTTQMHYTNEVAMPNAWQHQIRAGYRSSNLIAELMATRFTTAGGFDITRNNMPFPSNRMNSTAIETHIKYYLPGNWSSISLDVNASTVVAGRNVGKSTMWGLGIFYLFDFSNTSQKKTSPTTPQP